MKEWEQEQLHFQKERGAEPAPISKVGAGAAPLIEELMEREQEQLLFLKRSMERSELQFRSLELEQEQLHKLRSL